MKEKTLSLFVAKIIDEQKKLKYKSLVELLQHQTSINIMDNTEDDNKIDMRGFGIISQNNLLLINGLRIDENLMENPSIYNIDLDEVSHIEISQKPWIYRIWWRINCWLYQYNY